MARKAQKKESAENGSPYKRGSAIDEAHQKIKEMLYQNDLTPGQRIICLDLGRRLGISITPVVQALNRLEASGFVSYVPNTGYYVSEISPEEAAELFEARKALELQVLPKAVKNITEEQLRAIQKNFSQQRHGLQELSGRKLAFLDARFHLAISSLGGNEFINKLLKDIFEKLYLKYRSENISQTDPQRVLDEHRAVFEALRQKDVDRVVSAMRHHLDSSEQRFMDRLQTQKEVVMF